MKISFSIPSEDKCSICLFYEMNVTNENEEKAKKHNKDKKAEMNIILIQKNTKILMTFSYLQLICKKFS